MALPYLPPEIIGEIAESLCLHCVPKGLQHCTNPHCVCQRPTMDMVQLATLAKLCRACKRFNEIVTPRLYHRPVYMRWWLLVRTLIRRPDLARHVKQLLCHAWTSPDPQDMTKCDDFPQELLDYCTGNALVASGSLVAYEGSVLRRHLAAKLKVDNATVQYLLNLCPNVEELQATVGYGPLFSTKRPEVLSRLKSIHIAYVALDFGGLRLDRLAPLTDITPNLTSITYYSVASALGLGRPVPSVRSLRLCHSSICEQSLFTLLNVFPNLETFEYEAGGIEVARQVFTPLHAQVALTRFAPNLRTLRLDLENICQHVIGMAMKPHLVMQSLVGLAQLEHLSLDTRCLFSPRDDSPENPDVLVDLLPPSICSLEIKQGERGLSLVSLQPALSRLSSVAPFRFPKLAKVTVTLGSAEMQMWT